MAEALDLSWLWFGTNHFLAKLRVCLEPGGPAEHDLVGNDRGLKGPRLRGDIGALIIKIGFWVHYTINIIRNPQHSIGNY